MSVEGAVPEIRTNILLVDDRPQNLIALEAILEPLGQNVVKAGSGEQALRELLDTDFAVILLDVIMPGLDGFETAALIKDRAKTRHIPIIFLTAVSQQEHFVAKGYTLGAVDYISKPFHPDILRAKVAVFVELYLSKEQIRRQSELLADNERRQRERALEEMRQLGERRYQELAESMPQIVWTTSIDGHTTYCNRRWYDYAGLSIGEEGGEGWKRVIHLDDLVRIEDAWERARAERRDFEVAVRFRRSDGTYRWHLSRAVPVPGSSGEVGGWIVTSTDIDDRVRAEEGLRFLADASKLLASSLDSRRTLSSVAELAVPAVADWCAIDLRDADGAVRRVALVHGNAERLALVGELERRYPPSAADFYSPELLLPHGQSRLFGPVPDALLVRDARDPDHARLLRELRLDSWIHVSLTVRGETIGSLRLATSESGRRYGDVDLALAEDLARRISAALDNARLYEAIQSERTALEEAARLKDEFLAVLSHELRSPLNATLGWAQMLRGGKLDAPTQAMAIETIERSARVQSRIIGDLLDVSRIITGKMQLGFGPADLVAIVGMALDSLRPAAAEKGVTLSAKLPAGLEPIRGDAARLQQIAWNLLSNAVKFTPRGGHVEVGLARAGDRVVLSVKDDGIGISPDFLPFVFDRFRQADSSTTRTQGGLGLGLSIVRHLAELHGGSARALSAGHGMGTTIEVDFPCLPAPATRGETADPAIEAPRDDAPLGGVRALVVEDLPDGRALFQAMLTRGGAQVRAVGTVDEALAELARDHYDALVSDIGLPGRNGYDLIRAIRARDREHGGSLPAIALTAYASESDRVLALEAGFQAHVSKPVDAETLITALKRLISTARAEALEVGGTR